MPSSNWKGVKITDVDIVDLKRAAQQRDKISEAAKFEQPVKGAVSSNVGGHNIVTVPLAAKQQIESFSPGKIKDKKGVKYKDLQKRFPENRQNSRFQISELARGPLSVNREEELRIQKEIAKRLNEQLGKVREEVKKEAFETGFEEGKKLGQQEVLAASKPMLSSLERLIKQFESMSLDVFRANEEFLIHMVYRLAKSIILREIKEDKDYVRRLTETVLERLGTRENIKVFVSPKEISATQTLKQDLAQNLGELKNISIEIDSEIETAGCRIETDFGEVDARIEVQLENLAQTLGVKS